MNVPKVGFAGMTHLGINSLAATAARGFSVMGFDGDVSLIDRLQNHNLPVVEPGLDDLIASHAEKIRFTSLAPDLKQCDIVYISADVPTDDNAKSDLAPILDLIDHVAKNLREDALLVILCQVPPGFSRSLKAVPHQRLIYQVETLVFGRAIERALNPERFIVGCEDPQSPLPTSYKILLEAFDCPILPMRYESAELAKISINFCLVASVSVANTLAEVSELIGADWSEIAPALKLDRRIGPYAYLSPGLGISGGNLERDLRTVIDIGEKKGTDIGVVKAWLENSRHRKDWCWQILQEAVLKKNPNPRIAVLGLAYKENTHSTKNSPSLALLDHLKGLDVHVHDPVVLPSVVPFAKGFKDPISCAEGADVIVIITPWPEYRDISLTKLSRVMSGRVVLDPYRMFDCNEVVSAGFSYYALGMSPLGLEKKVEGQGA
ncbi:MAG: nucleotide sugar dehydrogenase [Leptospirales bacterium]